MMKVQITIPRLWVELTGQHGTEYVLFDDLPRGSLEHNLRLLSDASGCPVRLSTSFAQYFETQYTESIQVINGFGVRLSAPGYLDCTPWVVFKDLQEARAYADTLRDDERSTHDECTAGEEVQS